MQSLYVAAGAVKNASRELYSYTWDTALSYFSSLQATGVVHTQYALTGGAVAGSHPLTIGGVPAVPPTPDTQSRECKSCHEPIGTTTRYRYNCKSCGGAFCDTHLPFKDYVAAWGYGQTVRVCESCHNNIQQQAYLQRVAWRCARVQAFFDGSLKPFEENLEDPNTEKAKRGVAAAVVVIKSLPFMGTWIPLVARSAELVLRHGALTLKTLMLQHHFTEAAATFLAMADGVVEVTAQDVVLGMYYLMAEKRWQRGCRPALDEQQHRDCPLVSDELLGELRYFAPLALKIAYQSSEFDIQRLCSLVGYDTTTTTHPRDYRPGFRLIFAEPVSVHEQPSFFVAAHEQTRTAVLVVTGTRDINDVLTDVRAAAIRFPPANTDTHTTTEQPENACEQGGEQRDIPRTFAHGGMARAALWLRDEAGLCLQGLHERGYSIVLTGHSLGAGCAALLAVLLRPTIPTIRAYCYATPPTMDSPLARMCNDYVTSVIAGDDVIPRATPPNIRELLRELKDFSGKWPELLEEDKKATIDRVKGVWAPRRRVKRRKSEKTMAMDLDEGNTPNQEGDTSTIKGNEPLATAAPEPITDRALGVPLIPTLGGDDVPLELQEVAELWGEDEGKEGGEGRGEKRSHSRQEGRGDGEESGEELVGLLEGRPVEGVSLTVDLVCPGTLVHIYRNRSLWTAVHVPPDHPSMTSLVLDTYMLDDHRGSTYYDALLVAHASRSALQGAPEWGAYDQRDTCSCCDCDFTWASTSSSRAQHAWDRHNCAHCGDVVCGPCSVIAGQRVQWGWWWRLGYAIGASLLLVRCVVWLSMKNRIEGVVELAW